MSDKQLELMVEQTKAVEKWKTLCRRMVAKIDKLRLDTEGISPCEESVIVEWDDLDLVEFDEAKRLLAEG